MISSITLSGIHELERLQADNDHFQNNDIFCPHLLNTKDNVTVDFSHRIACCEQLSSSMEEHYDDMAGTWIGKNYPK